MRKFLKFISRSSISTFILILHINLIRNKNYNYQMNITNNTVKIILYINFVVMSYGFVFDVFALH